MTNLVESNQTTKGSFLDTLELTAENRSAKIQTSHSELNRQTLLKSVRRKSFQNHYLPLLAQLAEQEKNEYWRKRAWKVWRCSENLYINEGKYSRHRCNLSECIVCQHYKTSKRIKTYLPVLSSLQNLQFVTLTVPNVLAFQLRATIRTMSDIHRAIRDLLRKQGITLRGVRNLEVTFNPDRSDFHPHFHCIVDGRYEAELLVYHWFRLWDKQSVILSDQAQDIRPFGSKESDLLEAFKYANKVITGKYGEQKKIYTWGLYESIKATSGGSGGIRTFQSFGIKLSDYSTKANPDSFTADTSLPDGSYRFIFDKDAGFFDYVDLSSGETLTDYQMPEKMREMLRDDIV